MVLANRQWRDVKDSPGGDIDPTFLNAGDIKLKNIQGIGRFPIPMRATAAAELLTIQAVFAQIPLIRSERNRNFEAIGAGGFDREVRVDVFQGTQLSGKPQPFMLQNISSPCAFISSRFSFRSEVAGDVVNA